MTEVCFLILKMIRLEFALVLLGQRKKNQDEFRGGGQGNGYYELVEN